MGAWASGVEVPHGDLAAQHAAGEGVGGGGGGVILGGRALTAHATERRGGGAGHEREPNGAKQRQIRGGHLTGHVPPPGEQMLMWPVDRLVVSGTDAAAALAPFRTLPPYQFMAAVRESRAVLIDESMLSCVSHRRIDGYEQLARALHPEVFK